jgi:putative addiction module component (TIGR02574 family)
MAKPAFDFRSLSIAERLQLVEDVWDSIAAEQPDAHALPITVAERAEVDRRLAAHANDPGAAVPWSQVRAALTRPTKRRPRAKRAKKPKRGDDAALRVSSRSPRRTP